LLKKEYYFVRAFAGKKVENNFTKMFSPITKTDGFHKTTPNVNVEAFGSINLKRFTTSYPLLLVRAVNNICYSRASELRFM